MLLKGAAAGGKFNEMTDRLKGIYKEAAGNVATNDDLNKFYHRLRSLTADQISWMEMVLYPETVANNKDNARLLYETMYKCSIGKWMRAYNYKTRRYQATKEAEELQRKLENADYKKLKNGYDSDVFNRLPCAFYKTLYYNIKGIFSDVDKLVDAIESLKRSVVIRDSTDNRHILDEERINIVTSVDSEFWENLAKITDAIDGTYYLSV